MNPTDSPGPGVPGSIPPRRRRLRAVFAADIANFGGLVTIDETQTLDALWITRRVAIEELANHGGWLFGLPGDGIFALFESTVDAVRCALCIQSRLAESPKLHALKLRIGVHLGEVLFQDDLPFGEALVIASRLESLAQPGGILVSASVMDAVASRIAATFIESGVPNLKHSPRRIETYHVLPAPPASEPRQAVAPLDRTLAPKPVSPQETTPRNALADAAAIPQMPKASPLVLPTGLTTAEPPPADAPRSIAPVSPLPAKAPAKGDGLEKAQTPGERGASLDDASISQIVTLLATHLGPIARVLVRRKVAESADAAQLIGMLAQEIPRESERSIFLNRAKAMLTRPH